MQLGNYLFVKIKNRKN